MKQYIKTEQIQELSPSAKNILTKWWYGKRYQYNDFDADGDEIREPLMSIGQMIEFLDEHGIKEIKFKKMLSGSYRVMIWKDSEDMFNGEQGSEIELCDALWEAVKEVLFKEANQESSDKVQATSEVSERAGLEK